MPRRGNESRPLTAVWRRLERWLTPRVPVITLADLPQAGAPDAAKDSVSADGRPVQLVDVRSTGECAVSIIPGAITAAEYERDPAVFEDRLIVPYCTLGFRSAWYTRRLMHRGVAAVNFRGSIIAWAEAGGPLVTPDGEGTRRLHTWSRRIAAPAGYEQVVD